MAHPIQTIPTELLREIFSFIRFEGKDWLHVKLVCKKWIAIGTRIFDPNTVRAVERLLERGLEDCLVKLLDDERIDPTANDNSTMCTACKQGFQKVVKRLLEDTFRQDRVPIWAFLCSQHALLQNRPIWKEEFGNEMDFDADVAGSVKVKNNNRCILAHTIDVSIE
eukprot:TRINITY_DN6562_c0_g1_i1.p1 TRINITY_DN6562_c0_g1~~TRINITY_DN6562_c0_g1_i1.p1  ORF type:complete len:166 (+),score=20.93 TRINITY_DN6562_c0_g1_i1:110-607(+)